MGRCPRAAPVGSRFRGNDVAPGMTWGRGAPRPVAALAMFVVMAHQPQRDERGRIKPPRRTRRRGRGGGRAHASTATTCCARPSCAAWRGRVPAASGRPPGVGDGQAGHLAREHLPVHRGASEEDEGLRLAELPAEEEGDAGAALAQGPQFRPVHQGTAPRSRNGLRRSPGARVRALGGGHDAVRGEEAGVVGPARTGVAAHAPPEAGEQGGGGGCAGDAMRLSARH